MSWGDLVSGARAVTLATFAEPVVLISGFQRIDATGIFWAPHDLRDVGGVGVESPDPELELDTDSYSAAGIAQGDRVSVRGQELTIVSIKHDDAGSTWLTLRGFDA